MYFKTYNNGASLIEVLIALIIFSTGFFAIMAIELRALKWTGESEQLSQINLKWCAENELNYLEAG